MNSAERVDYLVKVLEGNNAKRFSDKTGIGTSTVCNLRKGRTRLEKHIDRICSAYPNVNRKWLLTGVGASGIDIKTKTPEDYEEEIKYLKGLVRVLTKELKQNQAVIGKLMKP